LKGGYGHHYSCPAGYVAIGSCESGRDADCKIDGKWYYNGLKCCLIRNDKHYVY